MKQQAWLRHRRLVGGLAVVAAGALSLAACGNPAAPAPTKQSAGNAIDALATQSGIKLQISLGVSANQLMQMDKKAGGNDGFTPKVAATIASSSVVLDFN